MPDRKTEKLTDAAEKTTAVLQGLQSRLSREAGSARGSRLEIPDDLGKQLEEYFAASLPGSGVALEELRKRVIEGVAEKILRQWQDAGGQLSPSFKDALVERLTERVLDSLL